MKHYIVLKKNALFIETDAVHYISHMIWFILATGYLLLRTCDPIDIKWNREMQLVALDTLISRP
jgi:hypothetical protein